MSDGAPAGEGAGGGGAPPATPPAAAPPAGGDKPFYEAFADEGVRTSPSVQRYKTAEELAKGYVNLEKRFGVDPNRRIDLPADMNDAEAMRGVWSKLGLPEKADGYGLTPDEKATDADKAMFGKFLEHAHKSGMPTGMAKAAIEFWVQENATAVEQFERGQAERKTAGEAALKETFGAAYDARVQEIGRTLEQLDPNGESGLTKENLASYPGVTKILAAMLDRMAEPGAIGDRSGEAAGADRPMSPSQAQAKLRTFNADPVKSKALRDKNDPLHATVLAERSALLKAADGQA